MDDSTLEKRSLGPLSPRRSFRRRSTKENLRRVQCGRQHESGQESRQRSPQTEKHQKTCWYQRLMNKIECLDDEPSHALFISYLLGTDARSQSGRSFCTAPGTCPCGMAIYVLGCHIKTCDLKASIRRTISFGRDARIRCTVHSRGAFLGTILLAVNPSTALEECDSASEAILEAEKWAIQCPRWILHSSVPVLQ